jgi:hypothetical protein
MMALFCVRLRLDLKPTSRVHVVHVLWHQESICLTLALLDAKLLASFAYVRVTKVSRSLTHLQMLRKYVEKMYSTLT